MATKLLKGTLICKACGKVYDYSSRIKVNDHCDCGGELYADLEIEAEYKYDTIYRGGIKK